MRGVVINMASSKLEFINGRPQINFNNEILEPFFYSDPLVRHNQRISWEERCRFFCENGVHIFTINPVTITEYYNENEFFTDEDVYCNIEVDHIHSLFNQAGTILQMDENAKFFVRFGDNFPRKWCEKNPDCFVKSVDMSIKIPSLASQKAKRDIGRYIENLIMACESSEISEKIIGYFYLPFGEGVNTYAIEGYPFDDSVVMNQRFSEYLSEKYFDIKNLNENYDTNFENFFQVSVPAYDEWSNLINNEMNIISAKKSAKIKDYFMLQSLLHKEWYSAIAFSMKKATKPNEKIVALDFLKLNMSGWFIKSAFSGGSSNDHKLDILISSGCFDVKDLLEDKNIDALITPADYTVRNIGFAFDAEGISSSLRLYNKAIFVENDSRTYLNTFEMDTQGAFKNDDEVLAGTLRSFAWGLTNAQFVYWMNVGQGFFGHKNVMENSVAKILPMLKKANEISCTETKNAICMILDDAAGINENFSASYQNLAILWQRHLGLSHSGVPYKVYLFSDLYKENFPLYRCYLFPNLFEIDEEKERILKEKIFKNGSMSIFGPLTGVISGGRLDDNAATRLFGVEMQLIEKKVSRRVIINRASCITTRLASHLTYGDSLEYGPLLLPKIDAFKESNAVMLGDAITFWGQNRAGAFINKFDEYSVAFTAAVPLPPELLREFAREGGCHIFSEDNVVIMACKEILAVHSASGGKVKLKFEKTSTVIDLMTNRLVGKNINEIELDLKSPETKIFKIEDIYT